MVKIKFFYFIFEQIVNMRKVLNKLVVLSILMINNLFIYGQPYPQKDFINPVIGPMEIIGTFCELRPNHFHGGLDIRTNGQIGRPIVAIGDGYISRVNISTVGYGKAIYITHPNGYTSVYAHLNHFPDKLKWYIEKNQYQLKKFEVELYPDIELLQVKKGEVIAYSGNTGGSQGPHLHFEIRETKSEAPINPLLFGIKMTDYIAPSISKVYLYKKDTTYKTVNGHFPSKEFNLYQSTWVKKGKKKIKVTKEISEYKVDFGEYSFGAFMRDYATSKGDNNGVNYIQLYKDGQLIYDCQIEKFLFSTTRMHNCYIDYHKQINSGIKIHKLFIDNGNLLGFYEKSPTDGWFLINDTLPHEFKMIAKDVYGNATTKILVLKGDEQHGIKVESNVWLNKQAKYCLADTKNHFVIDNKFKITINENTLYNHYRLSIIKNYGDNITIGNRQVPLDKKMTISMKLNENQLKISNKLVWCYENGKSFGGFNDNGWFTAQVKEMGTYYITTDSIKPTITPISLNKNKYFAFKISDNLSGIKAFDFYINDEWVLLDYESKSALVYGYIPNSLEKGINTIRLIVTDERGNKKEFNKSIIIK